MGSDAANIKLARVAGGSICHLRKSGDAKFLCGIRKLRYIKYGKTALYLAEYMCPDCMEAADISNVPSCHYEAILKLIK